MASELGSLRHASVSTMRVCGLSLLPAGRDGRLARRSPKPGPCTKARMNPRPTSMMRHRRRPDFSLHADALSVVSRSPGPRPPPYLEKMSSRKREPRPPLQAQALKLTQRLQARPRAPGTENICAHEPNVINLYWQGGKNSIVEGRFVVRLGSLIFRHWLEFDLVPAPPRRRLPLDMRIKRSVIGTPSKATRIRLWHHMHNNRLEQRSLHF